MGDYVEKKTYHLNIKTLLDFIDLKTIESKLTGIVSSPQFANFDETTQEALRNAQQDLIAGKYSEPRTC